GIAADVTAINQWSHQRCRSAAQLKRSNDLTIAIDVALSQIVEQATTLADHLQQSAPRVMVLLVRLEVTCEMFDPLGQQRNLNLGRAGVRVVQTMGGDDARFGAWCEWHV